VYEDRTQNYDPEIHEEYLIHDHPFPMGVDHGGRGDKCPQNLEQGGR